jgi:hypothetical protein
MLDYGYRSKCCKAALRQGIKKQKKTNMKIRVWVCVSCGTKDVDIISKEEALRGEEPKQWWDDEDDGDYRG